MSQERDDTPVVLFDGVCVLCSGAARFISERDRKRRFRFAHLQSPAADSLLAGRTLQGDRLGSVALVTDRSVLTRSDAALAIAGRLDGLWSALRVLRVVPRPVRDAVYGWVARNRYDWFGRTDQCQIPSAGLASRFVQDGEGPASTLTETHP